MSFTTMQNNSLKFMPTPLPEMVHEKSDNEPDFKTTNGAVTNHGSETIDTYLSEGMAELIRSASWEFNPAMISDSGTKYGREIDIYAVIGDESVSHVEQKTPNELNIYDYIEEYRDAYEPEVNITPLSVSVQSAKAKMTMAFDLRTLAEIIQKSIIKNINRGKRKNFSIVGVFYKDILEGIIKKPKPRKKGAFPNNMALLIRSPMGTGKTIHMKVFKNSSISMVGCKIKEDGIAVTKILEQYILKQSSLFKSKEEKKKFRILGFETTMVNSNYSVGFKIDRDRLFTFLQEHYNNLFSSYDPAVYAAVKIGFYYNSDKDDQDGICPCAGSTCTLKKSTAGKGCGTGEGQCKKVTIAIFESGCIVVTGGRNIKQANTAYEYINEIIKINAKQFALINLSDICNEKDI